MARKKDGVAGKGAELDVADLSQILGGGEGEDGGEGGESGASLDREETIVRLKACAARLAKAHTFAKGQLVRWKKGLKNKRTPAYGEPVIVVEVLPQPVFDTDAKNSGSPYFREPLTIVAGEIDGDGDFLVFHYDGRRFEPYTE